MNDFYKPTERDAVALVAIEKFYRPPAEFRQGEWELIADIPKENADGQPVRVYEARYPARFFKVEVLASKNSVGDEKIGYTLSTGSGEGRLAANIARAASSGMLAVANEPEKDPYLAVEAALSEDERERFLAIVVSHNPRLRGAKVADVLSIIHSEDGLLGRTEPFYDEHGEALISRFPRMPKERLGAAIIAAAILQPTDMFPLVERLIKRST